MQLYLPNPKPYGGPHYRAPGDGAMTHHPLGLAMTLPSWTIPEWTAPDPQVIQADALNRAQQLARRAVESQQEKIRAILDPPTPMGTLLRKAAPIAVGAVIVVALLNVFRRTR